MSNFTVGARVDVWSVGKKRWFRDGKVKAVKSNGSVKVQYNFAAGRLKRGSKWIKPSQFASLLRLQHKAKNLSSVAKPRSKPSSQSKSISQGSESKPVLNIFDPKTPPSDHNESMETPDFLRITDALGEDSTDLLQFSDAFGGKFDDLQHLPPPATPPNQRDEKNTKNKTNDIRSETLLDTVFGVPEGAAEKAGRGEEKKGRGESKNEEGGERLILDDILGLGYISTAPTSGRDGTEPKSTEHSSSDTFHPYNTSSSLCTPLPPLPEARSTVEKKGPDELMLRVYAEDGTYSVMRIKEQTKASTVVDRTKRKLYSFKKSSSTVTISKNPIPTDSQGLDRARSANIAGYHLMYVLEAIDDPKRIPPNHKPYSILKEYPEATFYVVPHRPSIGLTTIRINFVDGMATRIFINDHTTVAHVCQAGRKWRQSKNLPIDNKFKLLVENYQPRLEAKIRPLIPPNKPPPEFKLFSSSSQLVFQDDVDLSDLLSISPSPRSTSRDLESLVPLVMPQTLLVEEPKKPKYPEFTQQDLRSFEIVVCSKPLGLGLDKKMRVIMVKGLMMEMGVLQGDVLVSVNGYVPTPENWRDLIQRQEFPFKLGFTRMNVPLSLLLQIIKELAKKSFVRSRWHKLKNFSHSLHGSDCVDWLVGSRSLARCQAHGLAIMMVQSGFIRRIEKPHDEFIDGHELFQILNQSALSGTQDIDFSPHDILSNPPASTPPQGTTQSASRDPDSPMAAHLTSPVADPERRGEERGGSKAGLKAADLPAGDTKKRKKTTPPSLRSSRFLSNSVLRQSAVMKTDRKKKVPKISALKGLVEARISAFRSNAMTGKPMVARKNSRPAVLPPVMVQSLTKVWVHATKDLEKPGSVPLGLFTKELAIYFGDAGAIAPERIFRSLADEKTNRVEFETWLNGVVLWEQATMGKQCKILVDLFDDSKKGFLNRDDTKTLITAVSRRSIKTMAVLFGSDDQKKRSFSDSCEKLIQMQLDDYISFFSTFFSSIDQDMDDRVSAEDLQAFAEASQDESIDAVLSRLALPLDTLFILRC
uniref:EF-hand domain-containing protein n=1 Tax=Amorphochlora amoebiformis TaxID=1561963 RepID=A0A7S0DF27_9EUKA|mmetsp:Transcript_2573/g.3783  ORF Transcript_2573/g.3783 Transcript_2573/m.3783 type:complete len:1040 (+) Transcript_2573:88-3207(+)